MRKKEIEMDSEKEREGGKGEKEALPRGLG